MKHFCLVLVLGLVLGIGLYSASPADARNGSANAAIERFWAIYHGNDYEAISEVQAQLEAAIRLNPNNPVLYALLGATHFWHVGEAARDSKPNTAVLQQDMPTAARLFQTALDLDYYSPHPIGYVNDDHLLGYLGITTVHVGQMSGARNLIAKGDEILEQAVYQFPEFNGFNRWAAHNTDPKDSAGYRQALESLWHSIETCVGAPIDRKNPDIRQYMALETSVGRKKACWSQGSIAPHSFEGMMLNLANGLVKAGEIDAARIVYANARYAKNYSSWPYRDVLESIAASNLNERAALYADSNPANDPSFGVPGRGCVYCHATQPERR